MSTIQTVLILSAGYLLLAPSPLRAVGRAGRRVSAGARAASAAARSQRPRNRNNRNPRFDDPVDNDDTAPEAPLGGLDVVGTFDGGSSRIGG